MVDGTRQRPEQRCIWEKGESIVWTRFQFRAWNAKILVTNYNSFWDFSALARAALIAAARVQSVHPTHADLAIEIAEMLEHRRWTFNGVRFTGSSFYIFNVFNEHAIPPAR